MVLKSTKAMVHQSIEKQFKNLDLAVSTDARLLASESSSRIRGLKSELQVALQCCARGAELLAHQLRSPFGEIDLVFISRGQIQLVEVKSIGPRAIMEGRISQRQRYRLTNCLSWATSKWRRPTRMHLALVDKHGNIRWIPDFLS